LIPVFSWIFLKGKCRYCGQKISPRYILVELLTGILFIIVYISFALTVQLIAAFTLTALLTAIAFIDIDTRTIPNGLVIFGLAAGLIFVFTNIMPGNSPGYFNNILDALYGLLAGFVPLFLINLGAKLILKKEGMGGGDMKLMAFAGLFLGFKLTLVAMLAAIYLGGIAGAVVLICARIKQKKHSADHPEDEPEEKASGHYMAFGPFLALGSFIAMLYGNHIIWWYLNLISG
jgi:leader peptidase (prepilin peptidase)/N-methyltransferase